jgi:mannonate dehydratase
MRQGWRWFGPDAPVALDEVRQTGATNIVSSLHQVPIGRAWTEAEVRERQAMIETTPAGRSALTWSVVESIPIPDAVKRKGGQAKAEIEAWIASLEAVAACDIPIVCYNFMPVVDWTRTDLDHEIDTGATAMRFDHEKFAAFDLFILERQGADKAYSADDKARARGSSRQCLKATLPTSPATSPLHLPGSTTEPLTIPEFREGSRPMPVSMQRELRQHLIEFLQAVTPVAEARGVKLTLHPDDPPRSLFGLPRIASTAEDYAALFDAVPSEANGMCYCTGSLGVRAENDLPAIARRFASRIHFAHLRATKREGDGRSFHESAHLEGDVDMVAVLKELVAEDRNRKADETIVFRSDHGHRMLDDLTKNTTPGYPAIGRLRGLAELRGILHALGAPPN